MDFVDGKKKKKKELAAISIRVMVFFCRACFGHEISLFFGRALLTAALE